MSGSSTPQSLPFGLYVKSRLTGTAVGRAVQELRWMLGSWHRYRHPEIWDIYLEERRLPVLLERLLQADSNCVDVGCHIGSFLSLLQRIAPRGRHIAFEPSPTKAAWLKERFPTADVIHSAVGEQAGSIFFHENRAAAGLSYVSGDTNVSAGHTVSEVPLCRLDDTVRDHRKIVLIKIDVEGNELSVLRGARNVIEANQPAIIFEFGPGSDDLRRAIYDWFADAHYGIHSYADFLYGRGALGFHEFRRCGVYPFRAFNFLALPEKSGS